MKLWLGALLFVLLCGCSATRLRADRPAAPPVATEGEAAPDAPDVDFELGVPRQGPLHESDSPFQLEVRADGVVGRIGALAARLMRTIERMHGERDVVKGLCLRDKRDGLEALERRAREERSAVRNALLDDDLNSGRAAFDRLLSFEQQTHALAAEINQCVGEEMGYANNNDAEAPAEPDRDGDGILDQADAPPADALPEGHDRSAFGMPDTRVAPGFGSILAAAAPHARHAPHDPSLLIRTAELTLAVFEVERKLIRVEELAKQSGGYLSLRSDRQITIRVPRERFDETLARIEKLGDVLHRSVAAEDVTDQYVDLEMRLKNALVVRGRLEKLLEKASVSDAIEIQKELAKTTEEIERLQGKLKLLQDRIGYSTITVSFERSEPQQLRSQALLPFPWMRLLGLSPLLKVKR